MKPANSRLTASLFHICASAIVVMAILTTIKFWLYPSFFQEATGATKLFKLLFFVDIVLGPVLTFIVYKPGKKGLKIDLLAIVFFQVIALSYGAYSLYAARPMYLVFTVDRFELIQANKVIYDQNSEQNANGYDEKFLSAMVVEAKLPSNIKERNDFILSRMSGGPELAQTAKLYNNFDNDVQRIVGAAVPLADALVKTSAKQKKLIASRIANQEPRLQIGLVPLTAAKKDFTALLDLENGRIVDVIDLDPWELLDN